jgi:hypothetical protein
VKARASPAAIAIEKSAKSPPGGVAGKSGLFAMQAILRAFPDTCLNTAPYLSFLCCNSGTTLSANVYAAAPSASFVYTGVYITKAAFFSEIIQAIDL